MKKFDEILTTTLRDAYNAGYERGVDDEAYFNRGSGPRDPARTPPSFEDWWSGLFDPECEHKKVNLFGPIGRRYAKCLDCGQRLDETDE